MFQLHRKAATLGGVLAAALLLAAPAFGSLPERSPAPCRHARYCEQVHQLRHLRLLPICYVGHVGQPGGCRPSHLWTLGERWAA